MLSFNDLVCIHCERRPSLSAHGLCGICEASPGVRLLYHRRRGWTPQWEMHLRRLAWRAKQRLPLFPNGPSAA